MTEPIDIRRKVRAATTTTLLATVAGLIVIATAGYTLLRMIATTDREGNILQYTVVPRDFTVTLKEKGELKAAQSIQVKSQVEGRATVIWLIPEGSMVKKGDKLVDLASNEIEDKIQSEELKQTSAIAARDSAKTEYEIQKDKNVSDIKKAELKVELAKLALEKYKMGDWDQARKDAAVAIVQAEMTLARREQEFKASEALFEKKYITQTEYEEDKFNLEKAKWELDKAKLAQQVLMKYTHTMDLSQKESDVEEAESELGRVRKNAEAELTKKKVAWEGKEKELQLSEERLARLRAQETFCHVVAPGDGLAVYPASRSRFSNDDQVREGATVFERQTLVTLVDTSRMDVLLRVHESKTDRIKLGQSASIEVEGVPGRVFAGKISHIGVLAESQSRWLNPDLKEYQVEIEMEPTTVVLKPGVTAVAEILVTQVKDALSVPVQSVFSKTGRRYVFGAHGREIKPVEVKTGAASTEWVQIVEGVKAGDRVLMAVDEETMRLLPDLPAPRRVRPAAGGKRPSDSEGGAKSGGRYSRTPAGGSPSHTTRPTGQGRSAGGGAPHGQTERTGKSGSDDVKSEASAGKKKTTATPDAAPTSSGSK